MNRRRDRTSTDSRATTTVDPFATRDASAFATVKNYDQDDFYMTASDKRGHDKQMRLAVPPEVAGQIDAIVASNRFPYLTGAALVRDAVIHRLQYLAEISDDDETLRMLAVRQATDRLLRHAEAMKQNQQLVDICKTSGDMAIETNDWLRLASVVADAMETMDSMQEPYRSRLGELVARCQKKLADVGFDPDAEYQH